MPVTMECTICRDAAVCPADLCPKGHAVCAACRARMERFDCILCQPHACPAPPPRRLELPVVEPPPPPQEEDKGRRCRRCCDACCVTVARGLAGTACMLGGLLALAYTGKVVIWLGLGADVAGLAWFSWAPFSLHLLELALGGMAWYVARKAAPAALCARR